MTGRALAETPIYTLAMIVVAAALPLLMFWLFGVGGCGDNGVGCGFSGSSYEIEAQ